MTSKRRVVFEDAQTRLALPCTLVVEADGSGQPFLTWIDYDTEATLLLTEQILTWLSTAVDQIRADNSDSQ